MPCPQPRSLPRHHRLEEPAPPASKEDIITASITPFSDFSSMKREEKRVDTEYNNEIKCPHWPRALDAFYLPNLRIPA